MQSKLFSDPAVTTKQIQVTASKGVVTLAGTVSSEMERIAAANDAAQVEGVKTVVNNLQVAPVQASVQQTQEPEPAASAQRARPVQRAAAAPRSNPVPASEPLVASTPQPSVPAQPVAPPVPQPVTIEAGTAVAIRMIDSVDSEKNELGDTFRASLESPLVEGDRVVVPAGAEIEGRVVELRSAGRFKGRSEIALELTRLIVNGRSYRLETDQFTQQGSSRGKRTAATVGGGAALGAIIGGLAGGGKGAAIGAAVGAGAGTGVQAATKGQQIKVPSESVLTFHLESSLTVTPASSQRQERTRMEYDESDN